MIAGMQMEITHIHEMELIYATIECTSSFVEIRVVSMKKKEGRAGMRGE